MSKKVGSSIFDSSRVDRDDGVEFRTPTGRTISNSPPKETNELESHINQLADILQKPLAPTTLLSPRNVLKLRNPECEKIEKLLASIMNKVDNSINSDSINKLCSTLAQFNQSESAKTIFNSDKKLERFLSSALDILEVEKKYFSEWKNAKILDSDEKIMVELINISKSKSHYSEMKSKFEKLSGILSLVEFDIPIFKMHSEKTIKNVKAFEKLMTPTDLVNEICTYDPTKRPKVFFVPWLGADIIPIIAECIENSITAISNLQKKNSPFRGQLESLVSFTQDCITQLPFVWSLIKKDRESEDKKSFKTSFDQIFKKLEELLHLKESSKGKETQDIEKRYSDIEGYSLCEYYSKLEIVDKSELGSTFEIDDTFSQGGSFKILGDFQESVKVFNQLFKEPIVQFEKNLSCYDKIEYLTLEEMTSLSPQSKVLIEEQIKLLRSWASGHLSRIKHSELAFAPWTKDDIKLKQSQCPHVISFIEEFSKITYNVGEVILSHEDPEVAKRLIEFFCQLLDGLLEDRNFSAAKAIADGLNQHSVYRLIEPNHKYKFDAKYKLDPEYKKTLHEYDELFRKNPDDSKPTYKNVLSESKLLYEDTLSEFAPRDIPNPPIPDFVSVMNSLVATDAKSDIASGGLIHTAKLEELKEKIDSFAELSMPLKKCVAFSPKIKLVNLFFESKLDPRKIEREKIFKNKSDSILNKSKSNK